MVTFMQVWIKMWLFVSPIVVSYPLISSSTSFTSVIFYIAWFGAYSIKDYIMLVRFINRIFDVIKFDTKF